MRFSITIPDETTREIDTEAKREGVSRNSWIYQACTERLTRTTPETHQAHHTDEIIELVSRCRYQEQTINDLREERGYLRGEIARLQQVNDTITQRLLPPANPGIGTRLKRWISGGGE